MYKLIFVFKIRYNAVMYVAKHYTFFPLAQ